MTQTIDGRFRLIGLVGSGGIGEVWRAVDRGTNRTVAVKLLHPSLAADPRLTDRLLRARRALSGLWHPAIARLVDVVVDGDTVALVADFVSGTDLARRRGSGPLPPAAAAEIAAAIADALAAAHWTGVVHGDLKPSNVLIPAAGAGGTSPAVLTDFSVSTLVRVGAPPGTTAYTAPELLAGAPPTPSSDVHALGMLLHELVAGAGTDPRLAQLIAQCVAVDQAGRPPAGQLSRLLRELATALPARKPIGPGGPVRPQAPGSDSARTSGPPRPPRAGWLRRRRVALGIAGAVVVAAAGVATVNGLTASGAADPPPSLGATTTAVATSAQLPSLPADATTRTPEGGGVFVRYWFDLFSYAVRTGDTAALAEATSAECQECQEAIETIGSHYAAGGSVRGGDYLVRSVSTTDFWSPDRSVYDTVLDRSPRTTLDRSGAERDALAGLSFATCAIVLEWSDDRWRVREVVTPGCVA